MTAPAFTTLIQPAELAALLRDAPERTVVFDCGFDLADTAAGAAAFAARHIPGASHLHLDDDLSGPKTGRNGRHPLPARNAFAALLARRGVSRSSQVVVYDASGGMYAARAWWMLRWLGHAAVAVLDGGLPAWQAAGLPLDSGPARARPAGDFAAGPSRVPTVDRAQLLENLQAPADARAWLVLDARGADRFRGENETLDAKAGHMPGARHLHFRDNVDAAGRFKPAAELRQTYEAVLAGTAPAAVAVSCGSGVTACHNLLAMDVAGMPGAALYPGSWSEWSADPDAPVATGPV